MATTSQSLGLNMIWMISTMFKLKDRLELFFLSLSLFLKKLLATLSKENSRNNYICNVICGYMSRDRVNKQRPSDCYSMIVAGFVKINSNHLYM